MPKFWYNIAADLPSPLPAVLHPGTLQYMRSARFNLCGHGHFDMQAYMDYFAGKLTDQDYDQQELAMALSGLPSLQAP